MGKSWIIIIYGKKLLYEFTELLKSIYGITDEENSDLVSVTDRIVKSLTDSKTGFSDRVSSLSKSDPQEWQRERPEQYIRTLMKNKKLNHHKSIYFKQHRLLITAIRQIGDQMKDQRKSS